MIRPPLVALLLTASSLVPASPAWTHHELTPQQLQIDKSLIETGDLIFRRGRSWLSRAVIEADPASRFSHVGVAVVEADGVVVVHATPGDRETQAGVVEEPLSSYLSASSSSSAGVFRVGDAEQAWQAAETAKGWAVRAVPFDGAFEASYEVTTEEALYCTELVWKAYLHAGIDLLGGRLDAVDLPLGSDLYVLPSSLLKSAHLTEVQRQPPATPHSIPGRDS